jgi:cardiolipin synthase
MGVIQQQIEPASIHALRTLADQAFSRASGAPLISGNSVKLLKDAKENYPAWLDAIRNARDHVHFESYIIHEDDVGRAFGDALVNKAREGVAVRLAYDWMGGIGKTSRRFWNKLRGGGVEVRCYNPPRFDSPLGWISRDHRKMLAVDGEVGFVTGLCVGRMWVGEPKKKVDPWRDTGIEVRGPAVAEIERAFAQIWGMLGGEIPETTIVSEDHIAHAGDISMRVVATLPATAGLFRVDQLVAALARRRLWLTDAYFAGTTTYVQGLRAAASDGVDVRLLLPNGTDIPLLRPLSRAGYRPLLEAGVRVYEWNGTMLHAKTAVADGRWARVGSSNLNLASWFGNCELDAVIENEAFAHEMEAMYLRDLENATEIVLDSRQKVRAPGEPPHPRSMAATSGGGSAGRAAAGAIRLSNTIGAAITNRRVLESLEARIVTVSGVALLASAILFAFFPKILVYPTVTLFLWFAVALLCKGYRLRRQRKRVSGSISTVSSTGKNTT